MRHAIEAACNAIAAVILAALLWIMPTDQE